jgi:cell division protein FtsQ
MKIGKQRGAGSAAVLEAPKTDYASGYTSATEPAWRGQEPAPAGALQRGYAADSSQPNGYGTDEEEYRPRRGALRPSLRGMLRSTAGRVVLGVVLLVLIGGLVLAAAAVRYYFLHDPRFLVASSDDIQITGNTHMTRAQLLDVFGGDLERNVFRISLSDRQADLERLPWVSHASVMRLLPNQLKVQISERTPVAFSRQGTQIGLVDASGVLLDMGANTSSDSHYSFPVLTGIVPSDSATTRAARMAVYLNFMKDLDSSGQHFTKSVSEVDVTDPDDLKAMLATGGPEILVHFGDDQFLSRYNQFQKLLPEWRQQYPKLASADMRYQGQIVLEMHKDGDNAATPAPTSLAAEAAEAKTSLSPATTAPNLLAAPAVAPKVVPAKALAKKKPGKAAAKKVVSKSKKPVARSKSSNEANEKAFAALAAQHRAAQAQ